MADTPRIENRKARQYYEFLEFYKDSEYSMKVNDKIIPLTEQQYHRIKNSPVVPEGMILAVGDNSARSGNNIGDI